MVERTRTRGARRVGDAISAVVNLVLLWMVNVWPGWEAVPFLTADTSQVIPLVNASLLVGVLASLVYVVVDPPWLRALGGVATTALSFLVLTRTLIVFPFDFGDDPGLWDPLTEGLLILLVVATGLATLVQAVQFIKLLIVGPGRDDDLGTEEP